VDGFFLLDEIPSLRTEIPESCDAVYPVCYTRCVGTGSRENSPRPLRPKSPDHNDRPAQSIAWKISSASWSRVPPPGLSQGESGLPFPYTKQPPTTPNNQPSTPSPSPVPSTVEAMDVESPSPFPSLPHSQTLKEGHNSNLLFYFQTFFSLLAFPCHTNKNTMPYSVNSL
jgi:hypothetical protein